MCSSSGKTTLLSQISAVVRIRAREEGSRFARASGREKTVSFSCDVARAGVGQAGPNLVEGMCAGELEFRPRGGTKSCQPPSAERMQPTSYQPRSGGRMQPTAQAVGKRRGKQASPSGAKDQFSHALQPTRFVLKRGAGNVFHNSTRLYITGGTAMPITARVRINSRRTTATVASRNCFRFSSGSFRIGWR